MNPLVALEGVSVVREGRTILENASLTIARRESIAILGPNGAGKSTLVKLMTREIYPQAGGGTVLIDGEVRSVVQELRVKIASVSPDHHRFLLGDPIVAELAVSGAFGTYGVLAGHDVTEQHVELARKSLDLLGIEHLAGREMSSLSTGEQRKAWIARAVIGQPMAVILDEPTANLDPRSAAELRERLQHLASVGVSLILVTHHLDDIVPGIGRVVMVKDGRIYRDTTREEALKDESVDALFEIDPPAPYTGTPHTPQEYLQAMRAAPVYDVAIKTQLEYAPMLSRLVHNEVWLKREDRQPVFSFKLRGAYALMSRLPRAALDRGVIAASAGNHAQGVALAASKLGIEATIVVPRTTPSIKTSAILNLGANLVLHGDTYDQAHLHALELAQERDLTYVHPFDQPEVIAGQGTVGLEICEQHAGQLDAVFVAVGGGGLIAGIAMAVKQLRPGVKVIGVEPEDSDAMRQSLAAGHRVTLDKVGLLADGVAVKTVGEETFRIAKDLVDEVIVVSNDEICAAVREIFEDRRAILEPAGALSFAGLKRYTQRHHVKGQVLVAVACGANLNFDRVRYIAERAQVGAHREAIFAATLPEKQGSFRKFSNALGARSITEFNYRVANGELAHVFVGVQIHDRDERMEVLAHLQKENYEVQDLTENEIATTHLRHMVGGRADAADERLFTFEFPERAGALADFLDSLGDAYNITLFHYRNSGGERGRVLVGFQVDDEGEVAFADFLVRIGFGYEEVTNNVGLRLFL